MGIRAQGDDKKDKKKTKDKDKKKRDGKKEDAEKEEELAAVEQQARWGHGPSMLGLHMVLPAMALIRKQ